MKSVPFSRFIVASMVAIAGFAATCGVGVAQTQPTLNMNGATGLIDMPSGESQRDGVITATTSHFGPISRNTLSFQITPRLSGSFRYLGVRDWNKSLPCFPAACVGIDKFTTYYDRSFDLRYQLLDEGRYLPAVSIGVQDFVGTGVFAGEYIAATKHLMPNLKVTAGLGWGRLGSYGSLGAPLGVRPPVAIGTGGKFNFGQWFRGPAAPFGGVEWAVNDKWTVKAEYSSDAYTDEAGRRKAFDRKSPLNFGVEYQATEQIRLGLYSMYGSEVGFSLSFAANPRRAMTPFSHTAPVPVNIRPSRSSAPQEWGTEWVNQPGVSDILAGNVGRQLAVDGLGVHSLSVTADTADLRLIDRTYDVRSNAIGRAARALAQMMPASVETFRIIPVVNGMPTTAVIIRRSDLESLETAAQSAEALWAATRIADGASYPDQAPVAGLYPKLDWKIAPYVRTSYFDPSSPFRAEVGVRASADYLIAPGLELSGSVRQAFAGNLSKPRPASNSVLPHVRTDVALYDRFGQTGLEHLTLTKYFRPAPNLYARATVGYLEPMFAGVSGEVLWRNPNSRLAFGVEVNYARQRDFDMKFGLRKYGVITGHASVYADLGKGYSAQLDVGRYLAGDLGATVSMSREFENGWRVGAFATKTNVSAAQFGEGSFDKGIKLSIPITWFTGKPSKTIYTSTIRPITRDGGARLDVRDRLYEKIKGDDAASYEATWGRFWR